MPNPTPGQICYEAYLRTWNIPGLRTWHDEPGVQQRAWEAAAQAVLVDAFGAAMDVLESGLERQEAHERGVPDA